MPQEIRLSQLQDRAGFELAVATHIENLKAFATQVGVPRPIAHPLVEASIKRISHPKTSRKPDDYEPDYVIIDDTPPPPPPLNLADRKQVLLAQLHAAEAAAKETILHPMKYRFLSLQMQAAQIRGVKTPEDIATVAYFNEKMSALQSIELKSAEAEAALADVTEDTIDSWQLPEFG